MTHLLPYFLVSLCVGVPLGLFAGHLYDQYKIGKEIDRNLDDDL